MGLSFGAIAVVSRWVFFEAFNADNGRMLLVLLVGGLLGSLACAVLVLISPEYVDKAPNWMVVGLAVVVLVDIGVAASVFVALVQKAYLL